MTAEENGRRNWSSDVGGSVAVMFALLAAVILGAIGLGIDISRCVTVSARLEQALDAGALAGARMLDQDNVTDQQITDRVTAYVLAEGPILGIPPQVLTTLTVAIDHSASSVTASASGTLNTMFAGALGISSVNVGKSATVVYRMKDVELTMVLDSTGSMGDVPPGDTQPKINSLKAVATSAINTLYSQAINERGVRIAIVPFGSSVNAGSYASATIAPVGGMQDVSFTGSSGTGCAIERPGADNATDAGPYGGDMLRDLATAGDPGNLCPPTAVIPLSGRSQQASMLSTISSFTPGGSTAGHIGAAWGYYTLSPRWNGIFTGNAAPASYSDTNTSKNFVLMTDGLFNTSYLSGYAAGSTAATQESYAQFDQICSNMKANGITIYTIGFGLDDPTAAAELSNCASSSSKFFPVANGNELSAAFSSIVAQLNQLRIAR